MKNIWSIALGFLLAGSFALATTSGLLSDGSGGYTIRQALGPGKSSGVLAVGKVTKNLTGKSGWAIYCTSAVKYRCMSTATLAGPQFTAPASTWHERRVNTSAPFLNISTPTAGEYQED
jgi:hypothetical protein